MPVLLSIIEIGGYPDFTPLYESFGYQVIKTESIRKAVKLIRQYKPAVMVAEFNFQSDFRDRTSSLETLLFRVPLIKSMMFLAYRLICDQGIILKACRNLVKNDNTEHE